MLITECSGPPYQHPAVRTLVVDDSQFILTQLRALLGCCARVTVVATAMDGQQALDMVRIHCPDLVLMDLQMPRMNGFDAAASITSEFPGVRVVHITTHSGQEIQDASRQSGAHFLITKSEFVARFCDVFQQLFRACDQPPAPLAAQPRADLQREST